MSAKEIPANLYKQIVKVMPIPCVDLLVTNPKGQVLLVKRKNEPAKGQWWFPGGRVNYGELRVEAAKRKLLKECNLTTTRCEEIRTFDVILQMPGPDLYRHAITTLYLLKIRSEAALKVDSTSSAAEWRTVVEWKKEKLSPFVRHGLSFLNIS